MFASFFPANHPVGEMMDHLQKVTHFGPGGRPRGYQITSPVLEEPVWDNPFLHGLRSRAQDFLGTQGDGNHFAYIGRIEFTETQRVAIEAAGYAKVKDLYAWLHVLQRELPPVFVRAARRLRAKHRVTIRPLNLKEFTREVERLRTTLGPVPLYAVPRLRKDVHDLTGLWQIDEYLENA